MKVKRIQLKSLAASMPSFHEAGLLEISGVSDFTSRLSEKLKLAEALKWACLAFLLHAHIITQGLNCVSFVWKCFCRVSPRHLDMLHARSGAS